MGQYDPLQKTPQDLVARFNVDKLKQQAIEFSTDIAEAKQILASIKQEQADLKIRLEGFYGRMIEIFGLFIAIFSFIIAGIQVATKADGTWLEKLGTSAAIFIPVTICIVVLILTIRWTSRQ